MSTAGSKHRAVGRKAPLASARNLLVLVIALGLCFAGCVLVPGFRLATGQVKRAGMLKWVGDQQRYPDLIRGSLESTRERLNNRAYIQESLEALRTASGKLDAALLDDTPTDGANPLHTAAGTHAATLRRLWSQEHAVLDAVLGFEGVPYQDAENTGTLLTDAGRELEKNVAAALRASRHALPALDQQFSAIGDELQSANERAARQLQLVMLLGFAIAGVLVALITLLLRARARQDASLREARQQTVDILRTVKDGLFLLDKDLTIGAAYSSALETMFQRKEFAGLAFESLLKNIVSQKTLETALRFVTVLWSERTKENLVKSINPLGEVEVHFDAGNGRFDTRYLQFEFNRVRVDGKITHVLVAVSDVSARVELTHDLKAAQNQSQAQVDTLLGILHIEPGTLASFLNDSGAAMKMINAVLREPARDEKAFRGKIDTLFRQAHAVKGEAAALGLSSIESRAHSFEDDLKALREKDELSGNDFLPLVIKLDDLLTHLQSVGELVSRLSHLQPAAASAAAEVAHTDTAVIEGPDAAAVDGGRDATTATDAAGATTDTAGITGAAAVDTVLPGMLEQLAARVAGEQGKQVRVNCAGFDAIPEEFRRMVKDIAIQAVRNAVVHGIEPGSVRVAMGKPAAGNVSFAFQRLGETGSYELVIEDDGQGIDAERVRSVAVAKGLISSEQAPILDAKQVYQLLFTAGFTTMDGTSVDAGRGVGMNLIAELVHELGGRVRVSTRPGKFTRLTLTWPPAAGAAAGGETVAA